jgi:hypothetical protein
MKIKLTNVMVDDQGKALGSLQTFWASPKAYLMIPAAISYRSMRFAQRYPKERYGMRTPSRAAVTG